MADTSAADAITVTRQTSAVRDGMLKSISDARSTNNSGLSSFTHSPLARSSAYVGCVVPNGMQHDYTACKTFRLPVLPVTFMPEVLGLDSHRFNFASIIDAFSPKVNLQRLFRL